MGMLSSSLDLWLFDHVYVFLNLAKPIKPDICPSTRNCAKLNSGIVLKVPGVYCDHSHKSRHLHI